MFSLIISIISIALVAALAAATVYFGGAAFNKGTAGADASSLINSGQQIAGAFTLASTDGYDVSAATVANLTTAASLGAGSPVYLAQVPSYKGVSFTESGNYVAVPVSEQVCVEIAKKVNPAIDTVAELVSATALPTSGLFGCLTATAADDIITGTEADEPVAFYRVK